MTLAADQLLAGRAVQSLNRPAITILLAMAEQSGVRAAILLAREGSAAPEAPNRSVGERADARAGARAPRP